LRFDRKKCLSFKRFSLRKTKSPEHKLKIKLNKLHNASTCVACYRFFLRSIITESYNGARKNAFNYSAEWTIEIEPERHKNKNQFSPVEEISKINY